MLTNLSITNYALIEKLEMEPCAGLNMITGETGAGKSIMLGAVGLLLGNRADSKALYDEQKKCIIEGVFNIQNYGLERFFEKEELDYESACIIRREISPSGKSRAFINDTPVRLENLKVLGKILMDVHSQNETLMLGASSYQLSLIDAFAKVSKEKEAYSIQYHAYIKTQRKVRLLEQEKQQYQQEADYNQFQLEELSSLNLEEGEQASLEAKEELLNHAEEIKSRASQALDHLENEELGAMQQLAAAKQHFQYLQKFGKNFEDLNQRFESLLIELNDILESLSLEEQEIEVDFEKSEWVRERLSKIYQLQKKHGVQSDKELLELASALADKVFKGDHLEEELANQQILLKETKEKLSATGQKLSKKRQAIFNGFSREIQSLLAKLGMENARVEILRKEVPANESGIDDIDILFSANKGIQPQPIGQVASGGEFSRLMFAIKYVMADKMALPTLIFDEIDTGISGEIALQMVRMMQEIATKHQVICISHLPQVAAKGEKHYFVYKDNSSKKTISKIKLLNPEERLLEIAKMISGSNPSTTAFENAKELLTK
ncbi:DNA repair protein RecN [Cyclobacterium amurskyense]|uniref:DNA repair protein RecN n=1 Tax=Cyclobacterium amurskyense TaxID=320787 RepID=A0A0H4PBV4_9BACT|nr:DNA repair protein RecN [Cyclobacterium amurskyense]AKP51734.1 DNA repair protein RecN [Cyclobacterium amurskyense]|tara:strand:- start:298 stop:1950 length:1653 start_codon:yes stop_codon:yes gene_type:complete